MKNLVRIRIAGFIKAPPVCIICDRSSVCWHYHQVTLHYKEQEVNHFHYWLQQIEGNHGFLEHVKDDDPIEIILVVGLVHLVEYCRLCHLVLYCTRHLLEETLELERS